LRSISMGRRPGHQRGMTLIIALVFLLLLTLIGISSMQNATLQEKMAGSVKLRNESFQMAEAALRLGENAVAASGYTLAVCADVTRCAPPVLANTGLPAAGNDASSGVIWTAAASGGLYGVQKLGTTKDPAILAASIPVTENGISFTLYRITGVGLQGTSRTVLETLYAKQQ